MKKVLYFLISTAIAMSFVGCAGVFNSSKNKDKDKPTVNNSKPEAKKEFDQSKDFKMKETEHFIIYYVEEDKEASDKVGATLEENYKRIMEDLKPEKMDKVQVRIYPDLQEFHKAIGKVNAEDWVVGVAASKDKLFMVSPNHPGPTTDYNGMMTVAVHEFTHCVTDGMGSNISLPRWVGEGIAVYEAYQMMMKPDADKLPSLSYLNENSTEIYNYGAYIFRFIEQKYGKEYIRSLILNNGDVEKTFKCSTQEFEAKWKEYMKEREKEKASK